jgi:hypothetical protein
VEEDEGGVRACSGGDIHEGVELGAVAGELEGFEGGEVEFIGGGGNGCRDLRVESGGDEGAGEKSGGGQAIE